MFYCRYVNLADEPTVELKEVLFYVNDGKFDSNLASAYVTIITRNDAPVITLGQDGTVDNTLMYLEDQSEPLLPAQYIQISGMYVCMCVYLHMYVCTVIWEKSNLEIFM